MKGTTVLMINCKKCGAVIPDNLDVCLICGAKPGAAAEPPPEYVTEPIPVPALRAAAKRHPKAMSHYLIFTGALLILAMAAVFAAQTLPHYFGASGMHRAKSAIIYMTRDGNLKFVSPAAETPETLSSRFIELGFKDAKACHNGRYIAYLSLTGNLYLRDFSLRSEAAVPGQNDIILSSGTKSFFFTENSSHLIYLTQNGELFAYDFKQSYQLHENVVKIFDCYEGKILYSAKSANGLDPASFTLYVGEYLTGANNKSIVAEDVSELIDHTPAFDRFIFTVRQENGTNDITAVDLKQNTRHTLATGAESVISADAKSFTALYQTAYGNPLHYDNFINDDLAREDSKIDEPDLDDFPLLKEFYEKYGVDAEYEGSMEFEDIAEESAKLDEAIIAYEKMLENEKLRQKILSDVDIFTEEYPTLYDLYLCRGGNVTRISESSYSCFDDAKLDVANNLVSWRETNFTLLEKIQFSRFPKDGNILKLLSEKLTDKLYLQRFGHNAAQISAGEKEQSYTFGGWQLTSKGDGVYFAMSEGTPPISKRNNPGSDGYLPLDCTLYYYYMGSSADIYGHIFTLDKNVSGVGEMLDGDRLLYYKDLSGGICDLYMTDGAKTDSAGSRIGENISLNGDYFKIVNDKKTLLFCERFDSQSKSGNLFMYTTQNRQLATDVNEIFYQNDSLVYFTRNLSSGKAGLYSFGSNGLALVDNEVVTVIKSSPTLRENP